MPAVSRREFLARLGLGTGALTIPSLIISACSDAITNPTAEAALDLSSDSGVLNYFYTISQLQTDFWNRVQLNRFPGITTAENTAVNLIQSHALQQRNWLSVYQTVGRVTDVMTFDFSGSVNFAQRASTMAAGVTIEDSATQAYAGGLRYLNAPDNILLAGKLASIAARHSATLRDLNDIAAGGAPRTSFADDDAVNASGLEIARTPSEVIATLQKYFRTSLSVQNA